MSKKELIWFMGLPISIPVGIIVAICVGRIYRKLFLIDNFTFNGADMMGQLYPLIHFLPQMLIVFFVVVSVFFLRNCWKYWFHRQKNFNPLRNRLVTSKSDDQRKAQNKPV